MTNTDITEHFVRSNAFIGRDQVAAMMGVSPLTLRRMEDRGEFPRRYRLGSKRVGYKIIEIEAWITTAKVS